MIKNTLVLALTHHSVQGIKSNEQLQQKAGLQKTMKTTLSDEDVQCYAERYPTDVNNTVDPRQHFDTVGKEQGRLATCARKLTNYESQKYLDMNPVLQRKIGRGGPGTPALQQANQHYQEIGFKDPAQFVQGRDEYTEPWFCGATDYTNCQCRGTMYFGPRDRPDTQAPIKTFDEMRQWKTIVKETDDWTMCSQEGMGADPWPGAPKQCWCEPAPQYDANPCANEGEQCLCNGWVAYGVKENPEDPTKSANLDEMTMVPFAINDANNTKSIKCSSQNFEMADPNPNGSKQCWCDEKKQRIGPDDVQYIKEYWRQQMVEMSMTTVMETASSIESSTESQMQIVETATAAKETSEIQMEKTEEDGACEKCEIEKAEEQAAKDRKRIAEEKAEREKAEAIEKEKAERERQESIRRKKEAEQLKAAAEAAESAKQKALMEEEAKRMKAEADRLEAIAQIERERIEREQEIERQAEIRRIQLIEIERKKQEQLVIEKKRQQEIIIRQRRAEIERQRVIQEKKLIEKKVEAEIVKQKSITQMESSLVQSQSTITQEIRKARKYQRRHERKMRHRRKGVKKLEQIAQEEVQAITTKYEVERKKVGERLSKSYIKLNSIKEKNLGLIKIKTKESNQHRRIKEEAQNATISLQRRITEVQKSLLSTPACGRTAGESKQLEMELKTLESEVESNTKISELESKAESKLAKEAEAANTEIFDEEKIVNQLTEETSILNDKTEYAEAQKEVIMDQKKEEQLEEDVVKTEVEAFKANQTAMAEQSSLREINSFFQTRQKAFQADQTKFKKRQVGWLKVMGAREQKMSGLKKTMTTAKAEEKEKIMKQITELTTETTKDKAQIAEEEEKLKEEESEVKEGTDLVAKQEAKAKTAMEAAKTVEKKVSDSQDAIIKNCEKQIATKKADQKKQEDKLEAEKKKLVEIETAEKEAMAKVKAEAQASDKIILDTKNEMNKLKAQKNKLKEQKKGLSSKAEKQEIDGKVNALDAQLMPFKTTLDAEQTKKKAGAKANEVSQEKMKAQKLVVQTQTHTTKTAQELTAFSQMSCLSSTSVMVSTGKASTMSSSTSSSTTTREYSKKVHERTMDLRNQAMEKRSIAQGFYQQFKFDNRVNQKKAIDLKRQADSYTMSLEEYKSSLDMFAMKTQDITAKMNGITNETLKAEYSKELDNIKKEKEEVTKLIAEDKKDRKAINGQLKKVKSEIIGSRNNIKTLRLEAKKAEDLVASSIMSQTGQESVCEKKKIQAQQKQIEAEKNEKKVNGENEKIKSQITEKELKMAAHELNQKESEEVIESLNKRKASVEADAAAGNKDQVLQTIATEIATETARAADEKKAKETLTEEISKAKMKLKLDSKKALTTKEEAKLAYDEAVESCEETSEAGETDAMEGAFLQESAGKMEQKQAIDDEIAEMKSIFAANKANEDKIMTRISGEIKMSETKQTEAETVMDTLYKEIKASKTAMSAPTTKSADIVKIQADIQAREMKIDEQKEIVRIALEEKRKGETETKLIKDSEKEQEQEIANMTAEAETIQKEADGAKAQASDYLKSQDKLSDANVKKLAKEEIAQQKKLARLEKQLETTTEKTQKIKTEQVAAMQSLPASEHAYALAQKQAKKSEEDSLITTCTKLYVEKKELFTAADKAMSSGSCAVAPVQSCLGCGTGSTGVTQVTVQVNNKGLIDSLVDGLFEKTLVADIEEVIATKKSSSVGGEKKSTASPAGSKLVMVTADDRVAELMAVINDWSTTNDMAAGDIIAVPFKYGKQDYFDFVKESTKKKEVDFEKEKKVKQSLVQEESSPSFGESLLDENFSFVQTGSQGLVSQLVKKITH